MSALEQIQSTVLALPLKQRAKLAEVLLSSLPLPEGKDSEPDGVAEAERRDLEIESGRVKPLNEDDFEKRVDASLRG